MVKITKEKIAPIKSTTGNMLGFFPFPMYVGFVDCKTVPILRNEVRASSQTKGLERG